MDPCIYYVLGFIGIYQIAFGFINKTKNLLSSIVYKVIPFFSGMWILYVVGKLLGVI